jgi:hypothetical protein
MASIELNDISNDLARIEGALTAIVEQLTRLADATNPKAKS